MVNITHVDLLSLATSYQYSYQIQTIANNSIDDISFISYSDTFANDIIGPDATQHLITELPWHAFHEAGVYNIKTGKLYATSNWNGSFDNPINVTSIDISNDNAIESLRYPDVNEANGGAAWYPVGTPANSSEGQEIVFCDEGDFEQPSQLTSVDPATGKSRVLINNFLGRNFSSVNDVVQHPGMGDLWFTGELLGFWAVEMGMSAQLMMFDIDRRTLWILAVSVFQHAATSSLRILTWSLDTFAQILAFAHKSTASSPILEWCKQWQTTS